MPYYQQRGRLPRKRHVVFRGEAGQLLPEELVGNKDVVIPRGIVHRWQLVKGPFRLVVIESRGEVRHPKRYLNEAYYCPHAFSIHDFEPRVGRVHLPPPVHQTYEGDGGDARHLPPAARQPGGARRRGRGLLALVVVGVSAVVPAAARALLARIVDYAGLFSPAGLGMAEAVALYAAHRGSDEAWMLGRFVVPAARLAAFRAACGRLGGAPGAPTPVHPWDLSVLAGIDASDFAAVAALPPGLVLDAVETKASTVDEVDAVLAGWRPRGVPVHVELPLHGDLDALLHAVKRGDGRAKLRTGGVTADAFPAPEALARFLVACVRHAVPLKFTAGLHHPLRAEHPLTYEQDAPRGVMHGFLNVFAAAALARAGAAESELLSVLREEDAAAFAFEGGTFSVHGCHFEIAALLALREEFAFGFGSCSFREPVADLHALGLLPRPVTA